MRRPADPATPGSPPPVTSAPASRNLFADCASCFGLCCVALPFRASADFAISKAAGTPCQNLTVEPAAGRAFDCAIHADLRVKGFAGCTVYDCFGAGQQVSQVTFGGQDWRSDRARAGTMFAVFPVMRDLHELLWYLDEALGFRAEHQAPNLAELRIITLQMTGLPADALVTLDVATHRSLIGPALRLSSQRVRAASLDRRRKHGPLDHARADLTGASLAGADLGSADLRSAYLIGADLRGADLRRADLIGADLRAANLCAADLSTSIFLTQFQLNGARGDSTTRIPARLQRPAHWPV